MPFNKNIGFVAAFLVLLFTTTGCKKSITPEPAPEPPVAAKVFYQWNQFAVGADFSYVNYVYGNVTGFDVPGISHYYVYSTIKTIADVSSLIRSLKTKYTG